MNRSGQKITLLVIAVLIAASGGAWADFTQAMDYFKAGKYVESAAEFQALVDSSPEWDSGYFMLGQCFVQMDKLSDAEQNFMKAIELNGDKFEYHYGLATTYFKRKQYSKVVGSLRTAEPLAPDAYKFSLYKLRGLSYAGLEKWGDAIEDLEKARALKKTGPILENLGQAYFSLGYNDKAVPVLREAAQVSPKSPSVLGRLTSALIDLGAESRDQAKKASFYGEALQVAERYQRLKPSSYESNNLVGRSALGAKDYGKAEQAFIRVLGLKSDHCYAMVNLGKVHIAQAQWSQAETALKRAADCAPRMSVIYENLGFAVQKQKRLPEAIEHYQKAYEIKPTESVQKLIETCRHNIEIANENQQMDAEERAQDEEERKAQEEFEAAKKREEEWKKARERDD